MKDLTLSQQYALLALDGQESIHPSVAKSAVLRAVSAARVLERIRKSRCGFIFRIFCRTAESGTDGKNIKEKRGDSG